MIVEKLDGPPTVKTYRIHYRSGAVDYVQASGYTYLPQSDEIRFFDHAVTEVAIFPQASGIRSIINVDYIPVLHLIAELQNRIVSLEARVKDLLEKSGTGSLGLVFALISSTVDFLVFF